MATKHAARRGLQLVNSQRAGLSIGFLFYALPPGRRILRRHKAFTGQEPHLRRYATVNSDPAPQAGVNLPVDPSTASSEEPVAQSRYKRWAGTAFKMTESALTTLASIAVLGLIGYSYTLYYKRLVLKKMEHAFAPGDPVLELAAEARRAPSSGPASGFSWVEREEQDRLDKIVAGHEKGHYFLLIGEKGTGKSSMLIEAMAKVDGEGISMFDAHADLEIFRIRLGKALDFEYHEDNIGSLFSIRGPRDASALLDIERAFNKLEKVALKRRRDVGRPLVLIINSMHLLRDDDDGKDLLELIQQRAEQWAAGNLVTMVFNSDDYWIYERMRIQGTRMEVLPVHDLGKDKAMGALRAARLQFFGVEPAPKELEEVYRRIGGRLTFLNRVAKEENMLDGCDQIYAKEKQWFLNQCWILGGEMDDDVMDQQKYASAAIVLAKALVDKENEEGKKSDEHDSYILPQIPLHEARQIMTRADFIQSYDTINVFTIDSKAMVRADSVPMQHAFREICSRPGFEDYLQATLDRIGDIESLGRTREVTLKDLWSSGRYTVKTRSARGDQSEVTIEASPHQSPDEAEK